MVIYIQNTVLLIQPMHLPDQHEILMMALSQHVLDMSPSEIRKYIGKHLTCIHCIYVRTYMYSSYMAFDISTLFDEFKSMFVESDVIFSYYSGFTNNRFACGQ